MSDAANANSAQQQSDAAQSGNLVRDVSERCWSNAEQTLKMSGKFTADVIDVCLVLTDDTMKMKYWGKPMDFFGSWVTEGKKVVGLTNTYVWDVLGSQFKCVDDVVEVGWKSTEGLRKMFF